MRSSCIPQFSQFEQLGIIVSTMRQNSARAGTIPRHGNHGFSGLWPALAATAQRLFWGLEAHRVPQVARMADDAPRCQHLIVLAQHHYAAMVSHIKYDKRRHRMAIMIGHLKEGLATGRHAP